MKIKYIVNARIPTEKAHGYQICKMCEQLAVLGNEVELIVPTRKNEIKEEAFSFYLLEKKFTIKYVSSFDFLRYVKYLGRSSFYLQSLVFFYHLIFLKADPDVIIYTRNPEIAWLFSKRGYRTVYECHDWFGQSWRLALAFLRKTDPIIATNQYIKDKFVLNKFASNRVLVASNGVDLKIFDLHINKREAVSKLNLPAGIKQKLIANTVLIYTGSFRTMGTSKGIDEILEALKSLASESLFFLVIGGSNQDIAYYKNLTGKMGLTEKVFFVGRCGQKDLSLFQQAGDMLLMPFPNKAHFQYFMSPLKTFEYMASHRPIIASSLPSLKEILNDDNCLFSEPGNARDLASKIKILMTDKSLGEKISARAYADVKNFSWQARADKILKYISL